MRGHCLIGLKWGQQTNVGPFHVPDPGALLSISTILCLIFFHSSSSIASTLHSSHTRTHIPSTDQIMNPDEKDAFAPDKTLRDQLLELRSDKGGPKRYAEYEIRLREVVHGAVNETLRRIVNMAFVDEKEALLPPVEKTEIGHQERLEMGSRIEADLLEACFRLFQEGKLHFTLNSNWVKANLKLRKGVRTARTKLTHSQDQKQKVDRYPPCFQRENLLARGRRPGKNVSKGYDETCWVVRV